MPQTLNIIALTNRIPFCQTAPQTGQRSFAALPLSIVLKAGKAFQASEYTFFMNDNDQDAEAVLANNIRELDFRPDVVLVEADELVRACDKHEVEIWNLVATINQHIGDCVIVSHNELPSVLKNLADKHYVGHVQGNYDLHAFPPGSMNYLSAAQWALRHATFQLPPEQPNDTDIIRSIALEISLAFTKSGLIKGGLLKLGVHYAGEVVPLDEKMLSSFGAKALLVMTHNAEGLDYFCGRDYIRYHMKTGYSWNFDDYPTHAPHDQQAHIWRRGLCDNLRRLRHTLRSMEIDVVNYHGLGYCLRPSRNLIELIQESVQL